MKTIYRHRAHHSMRVEVDTYGDTHVVFFPEGGGPRFRAPRADFDADFEPEVAPPAFRRGTVTAEWLVDDDGAPIELDCYSDGSHWNGWGMPYFTAPTIHKMVERLIALGMESVPTPSLNDTFAYVDNGEQVVIEPFIILDGIITWPIGAGHWTWDAVTFTEAP